MTLSAAGIPTYRGVAEPESSLRDSLARTLGLSLGLGSILLANVGTVWCLLAAPLWLLLAAVGRRGPASLGLLVPAFGYAVTMLSVRLFQLACEPATSAVVPVAYGEHPVFWRAGLPWPGVEGSAHGYGMDRVPFASGVDALLVDFACWALLGWWCLRGRRSTTLDRLRWPLAAAATLLGLVGAWQLVAMFD